MGGGEGLIPAELREGARDRGPHRGVPRIVERGARRKFDQGKHRRATAGGRGRLVRGLLELEVLDPISSRPGKEDGALDHVAQLAHVARPAVRLQRAAARPARAAARRPPGLPRPSSQERAAPARRVSAGRSRSGGMRQRDAVRAGSRGRGGSAPGRARRPRGRGWWPRRSARRWIARARPPTRIDLARPPARAAAWPAAPSGISPISSRNSVPPRRASRAGPAWRCVGAGEGPVLVPEQLALEQRARRARRS